MSTESYQKGQELEAEYYRELAVQQVKLASANFAQVVRNLDEIVARMENDADAEPDKDKFLASQLNVAIHIAAMGPGANLRIDVMANCQGNLMALHLERKQQQATTEDGTQPKVTRAARLTAKG